MPSPARRSPLHHRSRIVASDGAARLVEHPFLGKLVLRGDPQSISDAALAIAGVSPPVDTCTSTRSGETAMLWIGPDERWIITAPETEAGMAADLERRLAGVRHQIVDVTDYYTAIELAGPRARDMLMKLTTLDLHPRAFNEGTVAGSMFGRTQATLWLREEGPEGPEFILLVRASTADYLWCLLAEAGREYGMPGQAPLGGETWQLAR